MSAKYFFFLFPMLFFVSLLPAQQFGGNPPSIKWKQIDTDTVRVIFPAGSEQQAARIAALASALQSSTQKSIGSRLQKINIVLQNQTTIANGYVGLGPYRSEFYMTPDPDNFSLGSLPWADNLAIHEYRHVQQYNNFNTGFTKVFSFFGGQEGRALANAITVPDWFFEGDAVFQETLVSEQGRGRMPSFMRDYKALWQQNKNYGWMKLRNGSLKHFVPDHYHLGYQLVAYGYEKFGNDFWKKITSDAVRFKGVFYPFNNSVARNTGKSYKSFREDALTYFKELSNQPKNDSSDRWQFITPSQKNNVLSYSYPSSTADNLVVLKRSYKDIPTFYIIDEKGEHKLRTRDIAIDDYFSVNNGKIVYAAYNNDARWRYKEYSDLRLINMATGQQVKLTRKTRYFSPDISPDGSLVLAVNVLPGGSSELHILNASDGSLQQQLPNPKEYFFTQTKFLMGNKWAVSAVRDKQGRMALVKIDLTNGTTEPVTAFTYHILGYPSVKGDTVLFSRMDNGADKLFAVRISDKKLFRLTNNDNAFYQPLMNDKGDLLFSAFTADGNRLAKINAAEINWIETKLEEEKIKDIYTDVALKDPVAKLLNVVSATHYPVTKYRQATRLFNFHSWRPYISEPEYGMSFYGNNVLNTLQSSLYYYYNTDEKSHFAGFTESFAGFFPVLTAGLEAGFNRPYLVRFVNTNTTQLRYFNSATLFTGISLPLTFTGGRTVKNVNMGISYNLEQRAETLPGKEIFANRSFDFLRSFFIFSNIGQQARQNIYPRWAQTISVNYRDAINLLNSHKLVATAGFYFPGFAKNHSIVLNAAFQRRDTLPDFFSKTFPFSRGYEERNAQNMYRAGINYHFPIVYPDWGFASLLYFQRIRGNVFFDYTRTQLKRQTGLLYREYRTLGGEVYFDTKVWNQLPISFGVRYSHLLDEDVLQPGVKGVWEIVLPVNIFTN